MSSADITTSKLDVRFAPNSGHSSYKFARPFGATSRHRQGWERMRGDFEALQPSNLYGNKNPAMVTHLTPLKRKGSILTFVGVVARMPAVEIKKARIMDGKLAFLYLIVVASITLSYVDEAGSMRHTISAFAMTRIQAAAK